MPLPTLNDLFELHHHIETRSHRVVCRNCNYEWRTASNQHYAPCPRCATRNRIRNNDSSSTSPFEQNTKYVVYRKKGSEKPTELKRCDSKEEADAFIIDIATKGGEETSVKYIIKEVKE